jgi:hypothetical protein
MPERSCQRARVHAILGATRRALLGPAQPRELRPDTALIRPRYFRMFYNARRLTSLVKWAGYLAFRRHSLSVPSCLTGLSASRPSSCGENVKYWSFRIVILLSLSETAEARARGPVGDYNRCQFVICSVAIAASAP